MKKTIFMVLVCGLIASCSNDDDTTTTETEVASSSVIRITEVNTETDQVTLTNLGDETKNVGSYWLCLGPGTYVQVSDATSESTNLSLNQSVTLSYDINPTADGLSLFSENSFGSTDPDILIDYVQWGASNQARVDQAVTAGRWDNSNNIIEGSSPFSFNGTATNFGSTFWN
ncbi:hypothetical protein [Algibacter pectinivorans]|nr:hypothetical protein [Algibacter pectinivorans]